MDDILHTFIEVSLNDAEDFSKIRETLMRIGVSSYKDGRKRLFQTCHIFQKRGRYYITHFKEMFMLDGGYSNFSDEDRMRRNTIALLLEEWNLCKILFSSWDLVKPKFNTLQEGKIRVIKYDELGEWDLIQKYIIGNDSPVGGNF